MCFFISIDGRLFSLSVNIFLYLTSSCVNSLISSFVYPIGVIGFACSLIASSFCVGDVLAIINDYNSSNNNIDNNNNPAVLEIFRNLFQYVSKSWCYSRLVYFSGIFLRVVFLYI
uniref:Uncharacterized protein n=1 Tax=Trichobilharzia regenti TaxID=157069 RepID=A0AA85IM04_TRIRE|nr:unnamed protein product [Trichobilharzia regenti]